MQPKNRRTEYCLYAIFLTVYFGAWFPAMAVYSQITFLNRTSTLQSFSILACSIVPGIILSGAVTRVINRINAYYAAAIGLSLEVLATAALLLSRETWQILTSVVFSSIAISLVYPLRPIATRDYFTAEERPKMIARMSRLRASSTLLAPPLAAYLVVAISLPLTLLLYIALCLVGAGLIVRLGKGQPAVNSMPNAPLDRSSMTMLLEFSRHRNEFATLAGAMFVVVAFDLVYPIYLRDYLRAGLISFSALLAAYSAGALIATWWKAPQRYLSFSAAGLLLVPGGLLFGVQLGRMATIGLLLTAGLVGICNTAINVRTNVALQESSTFSNATAVAIGVASWCGQLAAISLCMGAFSMERPYLLINATLIAAVSYMLSVAIRTGNHGQSNLLRLKKRR